MNGRNHKYTQDEDATDEVEDLLRQAEDAALLKMSVNGHLAHRSSSDLPPHLAHRFQTLKSTKSSPQTTVRAPESATAQSSAPINDDDDDPDDLLARFTALKASLPKPSSSASCSVDPVLEESSNLNQEDNEDEVDKIIRWAVDAARLDPSPESDDDDDDEVNTNASDSSQEDEDDADYQKKKKKK